MDVLQRFEGSASLAVVLGSGLSALRDLVVVDGELPYGKIPGLAVPTAPGHPGVLVRCRIGHGGVLFFAGRIHLYEGVRIEEAGSAVTLAARLGCRRVLLTNAAGCLHRGLAIGSWMLARDVISFPSNSLHPLGDAGSVQNPHHAGVVRTPLVPGSDPFLSVPFGEEIARAAMEAGVAVPSGVLCWTPGPLYETSAEANVALEGGADAVSMSSVPELLAARRADAEVAVMSYITNYTANAGGTKTSHGDILQLGRRGAGMLLRVLQRLNRQG